MRAHSHNPPPCGTQAVGGLLSHRALLEARLVCKEWSTALAACVTSARLPTQDGARAQA